MKIFKRVLSSIIFVPLLLVFLILTSVTFQLLNDSYLFPAFERNDVYEKVPKILAESIPNDPNIPEEERDVYAKVVGSIKPEQSKKLLDGVLVPILDFVHGRNRDIEISLFADELGFPGGGNIRWSLSESPPSDIFLKIQMLYGVWNKLLLGWVLLLLILGGLTFVGGRMVLLVGGGLAVLVGLSLRVFLFVLEKGMPAGGEPSQRLLSFLASTLLPEVVIVWLGIGVVVILIWGFFRRQKLLG